MLKRTSICLLMFLVVTGFLAEKSVAAEENVVRVLRTPNKAQINKYVCETLEFKNVNPFNLVNFFWAVTSREEGGIYAFVHPSEERGFLTVICPEYQLQNMRDLAKQLDRPKLNSAPGSKYIYHRMKYRNISDPQFLAVASFYLGDSGIIIPDVETNCVQIFDAPGGAEYMEKAFDDILDKPLPQLEANVKVIEINVNNDGTLGLDFLAWKNGPGALLAQWQAVGQTLHFKGSGNQHFNTRDGGFYLDYPSAFFDFLVEKGKAQEVLNTKISAVNRCPALLTTGEEIFFVRVLDDQSSRRTLQADSTSASVSGTSFPTDGSIVSGGNIRFPFRSFDGSFPLSQSPQQNRQISSTIDSVETGVTLLVIPTIGTDMSTLDLNLKVVSHLGYDGAGVPILGSRNLSDSIAAKNGDEVIFGGLVRERAIKNVQKIPVLGTLPIVGYLFGKEITTTKKSVVVAVINPQLVIGSDNKADSADQLTKKVTGEAVVVLPRSEFCFEQSVTTTF